MKSRFTAAVRRIRSRMFTPLFQVCLAFGGMVGGAALISVAAVGWTLLVTFGLVLVDGFFRQPVPKDLRELSAHEAVLERQRRAP